MTSISPNRTAYYDFLKPQSLAPLWEVLKGLVPDEPRTKFVPHIWKFDQVRPLLMEAGALLTAEEAERRVLVLENPAQPGSSKITASMYAGYQLIMPGEVAPAHRHTASALRIVLQGNGGYTAVAGEKTRMSRGDFIITPNMAWHDHGQEDAEPVIWVDGLDVHMVNFFETAFMEHMNDKSQSITKPDGYAQASFGSGLAPFEETPGNARSPVFNYGYAQSRPALMTRAAAGGPDPHLAHSMRYVNPRDGSWAMPTIATWLTHAPRGFETKPVRSTDGRTIVMLEGELVLDVGGRTLTAGENDVVAIPSWLWTSWRATRSAIFFSFSDRAAQEKLGVWREERGA
jgi:gentisate 1,2-dioxygenase